MAYTFYRIEYNAGVETVAGLSEADARDTFYNWLRQEKGFTSNRTVESLFPILNMEVERR